jgi:transposase
MTKFRIHLTSLEREELLSWVKTGKRKAKHIQYSHILLASDETTVRLSVAEIAQRTHASEKTVERVRKQFCLEGMALFTTKVRKTRSDKKIDARVESHLIALACQSPPDGAARWKLQLLADRLIELEVVEHISTTLVGQLLKKTRLNLFRKSNG